MRTIEVLHSEIDFLLSVGIGIKCFDERLLKTERLMLEIQYNFDLQCEQIANAFLPALNTLITKFKTLTEKPDALKA